MNPPESLSVVVVSDFESPGEKTWRDERHILQALHAQDIDCPFEVILVENEGARNSVPEALYDMVPDLKVVFCGHTQSARLKDFGVTRASGTLVAVLEADCLPNPGWLRTLVASMQAHPEISVVSGRTHYGDETMWQRCCSLLDRSFDNLGQAGETLNVSNNGALYRRTVLEGFPYPEAATPFFSSRIRNRRMREAGHRFYFEPDALMCHALGGWGFIRDFRRHTGYADMMGSPPPRYGAIPQRLLERRQAEWRDCLRLGPRYLKWGDWPLLALLFCSVGVFEISGMVDAVKRRSAIPQSSYR